MANPCRTFKFEMVNQHLQMVSSNDYTRDGKALLAWDRSNFQELMLIHFSGLEAIFGPTGECESKKNKVVPIWVRYISSVQLDAWRAVWKPHHATISLIETAWQLQFSRPSSSLDPLEVHGVA